MLEAAGVDAYVIATRPISAALTELATADVSAIRHHDFLDVFGAAAWPAAVAELEAALAQSGRRLSPAASCALCDVVRRAGERIGGVDAPPGALRPLADGWLARLLALPDAAQDLLAGG